MSIFFLLKFKSNSAMHLSLVLIMTFGLVAGCDSTTGKEYLDRAQHELDKKNYQAAIINLKNTLQQDPNNAQARFLLGKADIKIGDGESAEKELEAARRLNFSPELLAIPFGEAYLLQGKFKKLLDELKPESSFSNEVRSEILVLQAQSYLMLGETDKAKNKLESASHENPGSLRALLLNARLALMKGDLVLAQQMIEKVTNNHPTNIDAWLLAGEVARLKGDAVAAKTSYNSAIELEPTNISALLGLAAINIKDGDFKSALISAEKIQSRSPNHPLASYVRAVVLYKKNNMDGAEEALQKTLKIIPDHLPSLQMMGAIDFSHGKYEQARVSLERVVNGFPNNLAVRKLLASTLLKLGQPESAIKTLEDILPAYDKDAQLLALIGSAYIQNKNISKGGEYLDRAVAQSPNNAAIQTQLALGRLAAGKSYEAVEVLETAVELGQDIFQADILLALTHMKNKEFSKALDVSKQLALKMPSSAAPLNLVGVAHMNLGEKRLARESFEKAIKLQANFVPAVMNLAKLDINEGDIKNAKVRLQQIAKNNSNVNAVLVLVKIAEQEGNQTESLKWLNQFWEHNVGDLQVGTLLVRHWLKQRQFAKAIDIAKEIKTQHPDNFAAFKAYGLTQIAADKEIEALDTFRSLVDHFPDIAEAHYLLGKVYVATAGFNSAEQYLERALILDPQFLPAQITLSQMAVKNGDLDKAMNIAKKVQQQRPSSGAGYELEGNIHMQAKNYVAAVKAYAEGFANAPNGQLAIKHYQAEWKYRIKEADTTLLLKWLRQHPNDVQVRSVLAQAYLVVGNKQNASDQYKTVLETSPKNVGALNNLAWLHHDMGRKDALDYGKRAFDLAPSNPAVLDTYGWLLVQGGKSKQGLRYLQQAFQSDPSVADIQFHYAVALERNGETKKAREELEKLLTKHTDFPQAAEAKMMLSKLK